MALNNDFKVKNNINALGKILSGGTDLSLIFALSSNNFTVTDETLSFQVSSNETLTFKDGSGIDVVVNPNTHAVSITGIPATTTTIGVASFSAQNFAVQSPGIVYIKAGGVGTPELAGNIPDSKLATISTAGKVSNSATTATTQNIPNTIVLRGLNGEFDAGSLTINGTISSSESVTAPTFYDSNGNSTEWNRAFTSVNSVSSLTSPVTSDVNVGAISAAQVIEQGTTFEQFVQTLLFQVYYPTFTAPTASLTTNLAGDSLEVGFQGITLTAGLNRGAITGKTVNGVWQPSTNQDFRSGPVTNYTILGANNGTTAAYTSAAALLFEGTNNYNATVSYAQGPQPYDSKFINFSTPLAAGFINTSTTAIGRRRAFRIADANNTIPTTSSQVRALSSATNTSFLNPTVNTAYTIAIAAGSNRVIFAYPATLRDITSILYVETNDNVVTSFTKTTVSVEGLNGNFPTNYKVYSYVPAVPFGASATFIVTI
jgi:hypothetical protein